MEYDVFLSYSRKDDQALVKRVYERLCASGLKVWWDMADMTQRELSFTEEIGQVIRTVKKLVLFVGEAMPASEYVDAEWRYARKCGVKVYPVLYACDKEDPNRYELVPQRLRKMHIRDLSGALDVGEELEKLVSDLHQPLPPLAPVHNVPALPAGYVEREDLMDTLIDHFFGSGSEHIGGTGFCSVSGMGGTGKSTIASALCHDEAIRRQFEEIIWVRLGDNGTLADAWRQLAAQCGLPHDLDELECRIALTKKYEHRTCLFVFDNCTDAKTVEFLKNALDSSRCRVLLTFRENTLSSAFGIRNFPLASQMTEEESLKLVAGYCGIPAESLGEGARRFIHAVGKHALALSIGAAMYLEFNDWDVITESYAEAEKEFSSVIPNYEYNSVMASIDASVRTLSPEACTLFMMLSVFKREISIPVKQITLLWEDKIRELYHVSSGIGAKVFFQLKALHNKSLLVYDAENKCVTLHNLISEYMALKQDPCSLLPPFLEKLSANKDEYYYEYILYHLLTLGREQEARELLFRYAYQFEKIGTNGVNSLMRDFDSWDDPETNVLRMFYKLAAHVIKEDRTQIPSQLFGRFPYPSGYPGITVLMEEALRCAQKPFLCPGEVCMMPPGTPETDILSLGGTVFSLRSFGGKLLAADKSGSATLIDPDTCNEEKTLRNPAWCLDALLYGDCIVSIWGKNRIRIYDQKTERSAEFTADGLISSWATAGGALFIGDTTGTILRFRGIKQEGRYRCPYGISCLHGEADGRVTVHCINRAVYSLGTELVRTGSTEDRIVKRQGDITLSAHGKLCLSGRPAAGADYVKDFDDDVYINRKNEIVHFSKTDGRTIRKFRSSSELRTVCRVNDYVFVGDDNRNLYKWDLRLQQPEGDYTKQWITSMTSFGADLYYVRQDGRIYKNEAEIAGKSQWYNALAVTDRFILTADNVGEIILFSRETMEPVHRLQYGNKITDMAVDGRLLFVSDGLGSVSLWDLDSLGQIETHKVGSWITSITLLDDKLACSDRYGHIMLYHGGTMSYLSTIDLKSEIVCMTSHSGFLAVALKNGIIRLIDVNSGRTVCTYYSSFANITALYSFEVVLYVCTEVNWQKVQLLQE